MYHYPALTQSRGEKKQKKKIADEMFSISSHQDWPPGGVFALKNKKDDYFFSHISIRSQIYTDAKGSGDQKLCWRHVFGLTSGINGDLHQLTNTGTS